MSTLRLSVLILTAAMSIGCGSQDARNQRASMSQPSETASSTSGEIKIGSSIESAATAMSANGFEETMLAMQLRDPDDSLKVWSVGDGVLIVLYNKSDMKLNSLEYMIMTDGPKSTRQEFTMTVKQFVPATGELVLAIGDTHERRKITKR